jgi:DNA-binding CsgD family transcriptional regulator
VTRDSEIHSPAELKGIAALYKTGTYAQAAELLGVATQTLKNQMLWARRKARVDTNEDLYRMYWKALAKDVELRSVVGLNPRQIRYRFDAEYRDKVRKQAREGMRKVRAAQSVGLREHYDRLIVTQGNVCAICGKAEGARRDKEGRPVRLSVDHDHASGAIRELLCSGCNLMLGCAKDDPARLEAGANYLRKHGVTMTHNEAHEEAEAA